VNRSLFTTTLAALVAGTCAQVAMAQATQSVALPTLVYEGSLKIGNEPANGPYDLTFEILSANGNLQWTSGSQVVNVSNGAYITANLSGPDGVAFDGTNIWVSNYVNNTVVVP
jgi:hypothetical protein